MDAVGGLLRRPRAPRLAVAGRPLRLRSPRRASPTSLRGRWAALEEASPAEEEVRVILLARRQCHPAGDGAGTTLLVASSGAWHCPSSFRAPPASGPLQGAPAAQWCHAANAATRSSRRSRLGGPPLAGELFTVGGEEAREVQVTTDLQGNFSFSKNPLASFIHQVIK